MSKYKIRYIPPDEQKKLKSWSASLLEKKEEKKILPDFEVKNSLPANAIIKSNEEVDYKDNLLKKDKVIKSEDMVRMRILAKARKSILKLDNNKDLAKKLEAFNNKIRQKKLKAIVRAIRFYLNSD